MKSETARLMMKEVVAFFLSFTSLVRARIVRRFPETPTTEKMTAEMAANMVRGRGNLTTSVMVESSLDITVEFGSGANSIYINQICGII